MNNRFSGHSIGSINIKFYYLYYYYHYYYFIFLKCLVNPEQEFRYNYLLNEKEI